jgi:hypothetical protein
MKLRREFIFYKVKDTYHREKYGKLMPVVDALNTGFERNLLKLDCQTGSQKWKMKQRLRSGHYTTDIREVIRIKI